MHMSILDPTNTSTYLRRAVKLGLATVDSRGARKFYASVPNWQDKIHQNASIKLVRKPKAVKPMINSVWALGATISV